MSDQARSHEALLKASVIDRLISARAVDEDAVIVSEMIIADWTRRADIVVANGSLVGFEIKSEADSLARLEGQIETFCASLEKLILVIAPRFEARVLRLAPDGVGVWIADESGITERRRAKKRELSRKASITLMTTSDLRRFLICKGVEDVRDMPRRELYETASAFSIIDLANAARDSVKRRHRARHVAFLEQRRAVGTFDALNVLKRGVRRIVRKDDQAFNVASLPEITIDEGHPLLVRAPAGPILKRRA